MLIPEEYVIRLASAASAPLLLEAAIPNKLTTVSFSATVKDLDLSKFALSSCMITPIFKDLINDVLEDRCTKISQYILRSVKTFMKSAYVGTNVALGYLVLVTPLLYTSASILKSNITVCRTVSDCIDEVIRTYRSHTIEHLRKEPCTELLEAISQALPSYTGRFVGRAPDASATNERDLKNSALSVLDVLTTSSYWDLISYEVVNSYPLISRLAKLILNRCTNGVGSDECLRYLSLLHTLLSKCVNDTVVLKSRGYSYSLIVRLTVRNYVTYGIVNGEFNWFRTHGINLGTISDILASSLALLLMCSELSAIASTR